MPWPQALADPRRGAADGGELRQAAAVAAPIKTIENLRRMAVRTLRMAKRQTRHHNDQRGPPGTIRRSAMCTTRVYHSGGPHPDMIEVVAIPMS